jgi:N-glycosylase/DNA lyase
MDNISQLNKTKLNIPEIFVDFTKNLNWELIINAHFNETIKIISKERKYLEKNKKPYYENIMTLLGSISRRNGLRQLKKTIKFNEKFMPYIIKYFPSSKSIFIIYINYF